MQENTTKDEQLFPRWLTCYERGTKHVTNNLKITYLNVQVTLVLTEPKQYPNKLYFILAEGYFLFWLCIFCYF